jgi:uncharacterized protein YqhQ
VSEYTAELIGKAAKQFFYGLVAAVSAAFVVAIFVFVLLPLICNLWVAVVSAGRGAARGNWKEAIGMGIVIVGLLFLINLCMGLIGSTKYGEKINSRAVSKAVPEAAR